MIEKKQLVGFKTNNRIFGSLFKIFLNPIEDYLPVHLITDLSVYYSDYKPNYKYTSKTVFNCERGERRYNFLNFLQNLRINISENEKAIEFPILNFSSCIEKSAFSKDYFNFETNDLKPLKTIYEKNPISYWSGLGLLILKDDSSDKNVGEIQWVLMTHKDILKNISMFSTHSNRAEIPSEFLKLYVNPNLHPHAKGYFKKMVVPVCQENNIEIIERSDIDNILVRFKSPVITSISERQSIYREEIANRLCLNPSL